jgi:NADP-dependent 3-hydroxy acid dehydrogenase YdfG
VGRLIVYLNHLRGNDRKNTDNGRRVDLLADKTYRAKPEKRRKQMAKLDGKVVVITGASSGIGEATAEALAAEGASVVVAARREDRLSDLVERINGENGGKALSVECDVTDEEQAHALIRRARDEFGRVDILVNNAGVMQLSKIEKGLSDEWRTMFEVNVLGLLYTTDAAVQFMKEQGSGHLVNISSVAGRKSGPFRGAYSGTKFAVNAISEALRVELLEDNIRVTVVEPGAVETELTGHITDEEAREGVSALYEMDIT